MIKPSHYDDDGYPIQWVRSAIPSNTLACLNGLAEDARQRAVLGPDVTIRLHTYDETNRRVRPDRIIRDISRAGGKPLIALVGVQSNQFPRAVDLARPFLAAGLAGADRRLPHLRLPRDAAGDAARDAGGAGTRHQLLRRRGRGTAGSTTCCATPGPARWRRCTTTWTICRRCRANRRRSCRASMCAARPARCPASISAAAVRISARSAPSSTCRAARAGSARRTIWSRSSARMSRRASSASSSPTTISPATATGNRCSTG